MILSYDQYVADGGIAYTEEAFTAAEARAEDILNAVTLYRLDSVDWSSWEGLIERALVLIIETLPALEESYKTRISGSGQLTSFNNGVNSFGFGSVSTGDEDEVMQALVAELQAILPVELVSGCVAYNHAR